MLLSSVFLISTQSRALASEDAQGDASELKALLLPASELSGAAAACGIGIASGDASPAQVNAQAGLAMGIGKWVAGLVVGHIKGLLIRRLGRDEQYNRHLAVTQQLRAIELQIQALGERFDQLGDQLRMQEFRQLNGELSRKYVAPVRNGLSSLQSLECEEAAVLNAQIMGRDAGKNILDRNRALASFGRVCKRHAFDEIPGNLTEHFNSAESILDRYLEAVILPRRYLRHDDSIAFDDFFQRYHLVQIEALQLEAECEVRFPPTGVRADDPELPRSVVDSVYENPSSLFHRAQMKVLPTIMPGFLPQDRVILDWNTRLLWWNGLAFGAHPLVNERRLIFQPTIGWTRDVQGPNGNWRFELARLEEIEGLAALNAAMPMPRRRGDQTGRYPATLKPFLQEIGLDRVAERIPDSGDLSFVWAADAGNPIRRCHDVSRTSACVNYYDPHDRLGRVAATAPAMQPMLRSSTGNVWYAPEQCRPNQCGDRRLWKRGVLTLCKDPRQPETRRNCIADAVLGEWQAPGIYRARTLSADRFFRIDLTALRSP